MVGVPVFQAFPIVYLLAMGPKSESPNGRRTTSGQLKRAAGSQSLETLKNALEGWTVEEIDDMANHDGKNAVHLAAWQGCIENLTHLLDIGCNIDVIATGEFSYGKTPIFFASTRCRDDVVMLLLQRNARVKIVNNKGQSVLSIASSHLQSQTVEEIKKKELEQSSLEWLNFRESHSDGLEYGDLDPRFLERGVRISDIVTKLAINPTTKQSRRGSFLRRNPGRIKDAQQRKTGPKKTRKAVSRRVTSLSNEDEAKLQLAWMGIQENPRDSEHLKTILYVNQKLQRPWIPDVASRLQEIVPESVVLQNLLSNLATTLTDSDQRIIKLLDRLKMQVIQDFSTGDCIEKYTRRYQRPTIRGIKNTTRTACHMNAALVVLCYCLVPVRHALIALAESVNSQTMALAANDDSSKTVINVLADLGHFLKDWINESCKAEDYGADNDSMRNEIGSVEAVDPSRVYDKLVQLNQGLDANELGDAITALARLLETMVVKPTNGAEDHSRDQHLAQELRCLIYNEILGPLIFSGRFHSRISGEVVLSAKTSAAENDGLPSPLKAMVRQERCKETKCRPMANPFVVPLEQAISTSYSSGSSLSVQDALRSMTLPQMLEGYQWRNNEFVVTKEQRVVERLDPILDDSPPTMAAVKELVFDDLPVFWLLHLHSFASNATHESLNARKKVPFYFDSREIGFASDEAENGDLVWKEKNAYELLGGILYADTRDSDPSEEGLFDYKEQGGHYVALVRDNIQSQDEDTCESCRWYVIDDDDRVLIPNEDVRSFFMGSENNLPTLRYGSLDFVLPIYQLMESEAYIDQRLKKFKEELRRISGDHSHASVDWDQPQSLVGRRLRIKWNKMNRFFPGVVASYDSDSKKHTIQYDDGDVREYKNLRKKTIEWLGTNTKGVGSKSSVITSPRGEGPALDSDLWEEACQAVDRLSIRELEIDGRPFLSLQQSPIWVDTLSKLEQLEASMFSDTRRRLVAFDTEWTDSQRLDTNMRRRTRISTLQLAMDGQSWIMDLLVASESYQTRCKELVSRLFQTKVLLGFALGHDIPKIEHWLGVPLPLAKCLDLQTLWNRSRQMPGLAACASEFSVTPLSKKEQCSNWGRRPLSESQLEYAGLDAVVLLFILAEKHARLRQSGHLGFQREDFER